MGIGGAKDVEQGEPVQGIPVQYGTFQGQSRYPGQSGYQGEAKYEPSCPGLPNYGEQPSFAGQSSFAGQPSYPEQNYAGYYPGQPSYPVQQSYPGHPSFQGQPCRHPPRHRPSHYRCQSDRPDFLQEEPLPFCNLGFGLFLFILGFLFVIPWYVGAIIFFCGNYDSRERTGLTVCTIAAIICLMAGGTKYNGTW